MAAALLQKHLPQLVEAIPQEWRGTTFKNSNLLGREGFARGWVPHCACGEPR